MRFIFYSPVAFEKWCWRNSVEKGIGGAETSHVEMAWRIAARGHEVISYVPLPDDIASGTYWRGTQWFRLEDVDTTIDGWWILYRCPEFVDRFLPRQRDQILNLMMQDWDYQTWTPARVEALDRIVVLCQAHEQWLLQRHPEFAGKTWVTRNGIKTDLIEEIAPWEQYESSYCNWKKRLKTDIVRDPHRIMYASSPDRGLLAALKIFKRAREFVPDLSLHITYGFNNLDKLIANGAKHFGRMKDESLKLIDETGAILHGRLSQNELYREWLKTAMTVYCTTFFETGWITGLEAQALGAIPIFSPIYAQGENTKHGIPIEGHPDDPMTIARFAAEVVRVALHPEWAESIRGPMMADVQAKWGWDHFAEQWIKTAEEDFDGRKAVSEVRQAPVSGAVESKLEPCVAIADLVP